MLQKEEEKLIMVCRKRTAFQKPARFGSVPIRNDDDDDLWKPYDEVSGVPENSGSRYKNHC